MGQKFTITESERNHIIKLYGIHDIIAEQIPDSRFGRPEDNNSLKKTFMNTDKTDQHVVNTIFGIGSAFIPLIGPFIAAGIGLYDANLYYKEGDEKTAGLVAVLSLLPGIGSLTSKIPGIKEIGSKGMGELGKKLLTKAPLSKIEQSILNGLNKDPQLLVNEVDNIVKSMAKKASSIGKLGLASKQILKGAAAVGVCAGSTSCSKEMEGNIIGVKCSSGALIPGNSKSLCSETYVHTYSREIVINGVKTGKWETVKENKNHGNFVSFLYGKGTFCDNYPSSIYCLGKNY
jgi:hypothetical protein